MTRRKIWDIDRPPIALLVGADGRTAALESVLADATDLDAERVADRNVALDRLTERPAVDCCWIAADSPTDLWLEFVEAAADADPLARIVYAPDTADATVAGRVTALGAAEFVAPDATIDERRDRLTAAVDRSIDRRHDALKRSALDSLTEGVDATVFAKDDQARHVHYPSDVPTAQGEELFGTTDPEAFNTGRDELEAAYRDDLSVIQTGEPIQGTVEHYPAVGGTWQWTTKVPWTEEGRTHGLVGFTLDVSEWKHRERELLQQVGYLQRIPKYLTHDLRNPLAIARGYVDLAREGDSEALDTVEESLDRMSAKLTEFHGLVAHNGEGRELSRGPVALVDVVETVWDHVSLPGTELQLDVPDDATILADEEQLRPLLQNVFRNAIDHAGPRVTVRVGLLDDGFVIGDDGSGLEDVAEEDLFATGTTTGHNAAGLGLAIVREVAHTHGWTVESAESELGGAAFEFRHCTVGVPTARTPATDEIALDESTDVGDVAIAGSASQNDDVVTLRGNGANVWGPVNELHFFHATVEDDVRIETRVAGMDVASEYSKAGVMVRSGLDADAAYASVSRMADRIPELLWRNEPDDRGYSTQVGGIDDRYDWIALERIGEEVICSISRDGAEWGVADRRSIDLEAVAHVGLFVCSASEEETIEARFEDLSVRHLE